MTLIDIEAILSREVIICVTSGSGELPVLGVHLLLLEDDLGGTRGCGGNEVYVEILGEGEGLRFTGVSKGAGDG